MLKKFWFILIGAVFSLLLIVSMFVEKSPNIYAYIGVWACTIICATNSKKID